MQYQNAPQGIHRRGRADRLPLTRPFDHRCLTLLAPGLLCRTRYRHETQTHPGEWDSTTEVFACLGNGRKPLEPPCLDRVRIALVSPLQWLLRAYVPAWRATPAAVTPSRMLNLRSIRSGHYQPRPQAEIQPILTRIAAVYPAKHLLLLPQASSCMGRPVGLACSAFGPLPGRDAALSHL